MSIQITIVCQNPTCQKVMPYTRSEENLVVCPHCNDTAYCSETCLKNHAQEHQETKCSEHVYCFHIYCEYEFVFLWKKFIRYNLTSNQIVNFIKSHVPTHCFVCKAPKSQHEMRISQDGGVGLTRAEFMDHFIWIVYSCSAPECAQQADALIQRRIKHFESKHQSEFDVILQSCATCHSVNATKNCSRCQNSFYCNEECQRQDWSKHKPNCHPKKEDLLIRK